MAGPGPGRRVGQRVSLAGGRHYPRPVDVLLLVASPCFLFMLLASVIAGLRLWPDLKARHLRAVLVVREMEKRREQGPKP